MPLPASSPEIVPQLEQAPAANPALDASQDAADAGSAPARHSEIALATKVSIEPPYTPGRRQRPSGELAAAGDDELVARWNLGGNGDPSYEPNRATFHPGTRVVVETKVVFPKLPSGASGKKARGLTAERVLAQARSRGYWPLRVCYEDGLRRHATLSGRTRVRFTIGARGGVAAARLLGSELRAPDVASCIVRKVRALRFDPAPGRKVDIDLSVKFWPGDAPLAARSTEGANIEPEAQGRIEHALPSLRPAFEHCYAEGLARDAALWGRIALSVELDERGTAAKVEERESRFPDKAVVDCAAKALAGLSLGDPPPARSFVVAVRLGEPPRAPAPPAAPASDGAEAPVSEPE